MNQAPRPRTALLHLLTTYIYIYIYILSGSVRKKMPSRSSLILPHICAPKNINSVSTTDEIRDRDCDAASIHFVSQPDHSTKRMRSHCIIYFIKSLARTPVPSTYHICIIALVFLSFDCIRFKLYKKGPLLHVDKPFTTKGCNRSDT